METEINNPNARHCQACSEKQGRTVFHLPPLCSTESSSESATRVEEIREFCDKCSQSLPISAFYPDSRRPGKLAKPCKKCRNERSHEYRLQPAVHKTYVERGRTHYALKKDTPKELERRKAADAKKKRADPNSPKEIARGTLRRAVQNGSIVKPANCQKCQQAFPAKRLHGHHSDYSQPLAVRWLCAACHGLEHRMVL